MQDSFALGRAYGIPLTATTIRLVSAHAPTSGPMLAQGGGGEGAAAAEGQPAAKEPTAWEYAEWYGAATLARKQGAQRLADTLREQTPPVTAASAPMLPSSAPT